MSENYKILGFSEITSKNIHLFVEKIVTEGEKMGELEHKDLIQILNTFNTFTHFSKNRKLWTTLEKAVYKVRFH